jgi:hypothetical protein
MKKNDRKKLLIGVLVFFFIAAISFNTSFAYVWHNGAGGGYGGSGETTGEKSSLIEAYIAEGAGYYLAAQSDIQKLLESVELQDSRGIDYATLRDILNSACDNMKNANESYDKLLKEAELTPYNETVIASLMSFDYQNYQDKNGFNSVIFYQVADFLKRGDITGLLKRTRLDLGDIALKLEAINGTISLNKMSPISDYRRLNEKFAEVSLFGSYTASVFNESILK